MKILSVLALSLVLVACGGGSPVTLNQANFDRLHDDMSPMEVKAIMGAPTTSNSEPIPIVGGTSTTYTYQNDKSHVTLVFKNDLLKEKQGKFGP